MLYASPVFQRFHLTVMWMFVLMFIGVKKALVRRHQNLDLGTKLPPEISQVTSNINRQRRRVLILEQHQGLDEQSQTSYFPIQNLLKIFPNKSSVVIVPVISPRKCNA